MKTFEPGIVFLLGLLLSISAPAGSPAGLTGKNAPSRGVAEDLEKPGTPSQGMIFDYNKEELFQDNFALGEYYARADMALCRYNGSEWIPGDSIVVKFGFPSLESGSTPTASLQSSPVMVHVRVPFIGDTTHTSRHALVGPILEGTYGHYISHDSLWTHFETEPAMEGGTPVPDLYMFDLNDSLFKWGYMIEYYFSAVDFVSGDTLYLPEDAPSGEYFEFTILPTFKSDILFVDDYDDIRCFDGMVQRYFERTFKDVLPEDNQPDRYDVNGAVVDATLGRRSALMFIALYRNIIWDCGDYPGTVCESIPLLYSWVNQGGSLLRTLWFGFSIINVRDD